MAKKFLTPITPPALSADPAIGPVGSIYYNTTDSALKISNGTTWEAITAGGGGVGSITSIQALSTAPNSPTRGTVYFDTLESTIKVFNGYVWYDAGGPKELIDHTHHTTYSGVGLVKEAWYGDYVVDDQIFINGGDSTTIFSDDIIDGGTSNG